MLKNTWVNGKREDETALAERDAYIAKFPGLVEFMNAWGEKALLVSPGLVLEATLARLEDIREDSLEIVFVAHRDDVLYRECSCDYTTYAEKVKNTALESVKRDMRAWLSVRETEKNCPDWVYFLKCSIYY